MDSTTSPNPTPSPNYLKIATQIATITVAVLTTLTALGAVLVFTIHSVIAMDVTPRLDRLESGQAEMINRVDRIETRIEHIESRFDQMQTGQQQIIELLKSGNR